MMVLVPVWENMHMVISVFLGIPGKSLLISVCFLQSSYEAEDSAELSRNFFIFYILYSLYFFIFIF